MKTKTKETVKTEKVSVVECNNGNIYKHMEAIIYIWK